MTCAIAHKYVMAAFSNIQDRLRGLAERVSLHEDYAAVFGTVAGQRVLRHIMRVGNVTSSSFVQGDPCATSFREGQRHLALSIARMHFRDTTKLIESVEEGLDHE